MHLIQLLNSLDELLYAVMSWLVFWPVTLWRTLRHPLRTASYAAHQLAETEGRRYNDSISPPLFLLVTILISHAIEMAVIGTSPLIADTHGLAALVSDDTSLVLLRLIVFSVFPVVMASWLLHRQKAKLTHDALRPHFYGQCYLTAPFALLLGMGTTLTQCHWSWAGEAGLALIAAAILWYTVHQAYWFAQHLKTGFFRGLLNALAGTLASLMLLLLALPLFA